MKGLLSSLSVSLNLQLRAKSLCLSVFGRIRTHLEVRMLLRILVQLVLYEDIILSVIGVDQGDLR